MNDIAQRISLFRYISLILAALVLLVGGYYWFHRKEMLETFLSNQLNEKVTIEKISMSYHGLIIQEVNIFNPKKKSYTININKIETDFPIWKIFNKTLKINSLKIMNPKLRLELYNKDGSENSFKEFLDQLPKRSEKKFTIEKIYLYSVEVEATDDSGKSFEIWPIPFIDITGLQSDETLSQIMRRIFAQMTAKMISKNPLPFKKESSVQST